MGSLTDPFNVIIVGAGEINFGSPEGPWNHTARLEAILGFRLQVLALIDPDSSRSKERIRYKQANHQPHVVQAWSMAKTFGNVREVYQDMAISSSFWKEKDIHLIINGCPPHFRGTLEHGKDMDVQLLEAFGKRTKGILIEKPVAALDPDVGNCRQVAKRLSEWNKSQGTVIGVGYMLRYLKAVKKMKDTIHENNLTPTCINARYFMCYGFAAKRSWWDKSTSCGPVVEQATHFVDLIRHIAGPSNDALLDTVRATAVEHDEPAGKLSKLSFDEDTIEPMKRVPRITTAFWKHAKGTVGTLCHGITLQDNQYDTELEVLADGWIMRLRDAYGISPTLTIRQPGSSRETVFTIQDDPFHSEFDTIVKAIDGGKEAKEMPLSSFEDALATYKLTWKIRHASEQK